MAEGAPLLREYTSKGYRGFESLRLRQTFSQVTAQLSDNMKTEGHASREAWYRLRGTRETEPDADLKPFQVSGASQPHTPL